MKRKSSRVYVIISLSIFVGVLPLSSSLAIGNKPSELMTSLDWKPIPQDGVINASGRYCLQQDMPTDRSTGIDVQVNDVTLDLGGHALRYTGRPQEGTYGITVNNRTGVTIANGAIGGFWFNIHCTQNQRLRIRDISFDDIPYLAVNVAQSKDVVISDNSFSNFRFDLTKAKGSTYVIGVNIGAEDAIISNNRFIAQPNAGSARDVNVETVFVLFSANVSKSCLVAQNDMAGSEALPRSYGVWVATNAQATIANNSIRNMKYGVCLADDASALVCFNRFAVGAALGDTAPLESFGISALKARDILDVKNTFDGVSVPSLMPKSPEAQDVSGN